MKSVHLICFISIYFLTLVKINAQSTPENEFNLYAKSYPNESGIITSLYRKLTIGVEGDSTSIMIEETKEIMVLANPSRWKKDQEYTSSFTQLIQIEAYTLTPEKKKYKKHEVESFKKSFDKDSYIFFDDTELVNYNYPFVDIGAKIVTKVKRKITDPHLISQFFFASYVPVVKAKYEIVTDKNVKILHELLNDNGIDVQVVQSEAKDGSSTIIYEASDIPKVDYKEDNPSLNYLSPSVFVNIASFKDGNGNEKRVLSSLEDLHTWYTSFIEDMSLGSSMGDIAKNIVNDDDSDLEKIRKIFYWVQENIRYVAFEQGMRGFIPHPGSYVYDKRYGDCKDMTSILVAMLRSENIPANYTWIGSRQLPYKYSEIPSPIVDNHMIASVEINDSILFLDATGSYTPLGLPTSMIQGKEAFISDGQDYKIVEVPVVNREVNTMVDTVRIQLEKGTIQGEGSLILSGLVKVANAYKLIQKSEKSEENYLRRLLSKGSNKFLLEKYEVSQLDNFSSPTRVTYSFNIADYYKSINNELYINLCLEKSLVDDIIEMRSTPKENDFKYVNKSVVVMDLPEGYKVTYLPKDSRLDAQNFGYEITYQLVNDQVIVTKMFYVDYLLLQPEDFNSWNTGIKQYSMASRNSLILKSE